MPVTLAIAILCMNGPGSPVCPSCVPFDLDRDGDVDLRDLALLQAPPPLNHNELLVELRALPRLPNPHYAWPLPNSLPLMDPLVREYARITGSLPLWYANQPPAHVAQAASICREVDATICIVAMPWYGWTDPTITGWIEDYEVTYLHGRLAQIRDLLTSTGVPVTMIAFDTEVFDVRGKPDAWKEAARQKYNLAYQAAKDVFPLATVEWFCRGERRPNTWEQPFFGLDETGDAFSFGAYRVAEPAYWRGVMKSTILHASEHGVTRVHAWVALASGWHNEPGQDERWVSSMNYPLERSWQIGSELNDPSCDVAAIFFWPRPFDPSVPWWGDHFIAYVRGAIGEGLPQCP